MPADRFHRSSLSIEMSRNCLNSMNRSAPDRTQFFYLVRTPDAATKARLGSMIGRMLVLFLGVLSTSLSLAQTWRSSLYPADWTPPVNSLFASDQMIQDFSYAGYRRGESEIPTPNTRVLNAVTQYGADPTGVADSTKAIQTALDVVGSTGGGVVLLPPGTYRISLPTARSSSVLHLSKDNTILRGSGVDKTFLLNHSTEMRSKSILFIRGNDSPFPIHSSLLTADVLSPSKRLHVADASSFGVGDIVSVRWDFTQAWIDEHGQTSAWTAGVNAPAPANYQREIMAVNVAEGWIETDIPARYYHLVRDNARVEKYDSRIEECGIEGLSIGNVQHPGTGWQPEDYLIQGTGGHEVHASWVIFVNRARNCWVRDVHSYLPAGNSFTCHILSNGIQIGMSSNITLQNCSMKRPEYGGGGGNGYMFRLTHGNDCLIDNCLADFSRHGFVNSHAGSSGNVFHKCEDRNTKSSTGDTGYVQTDGDGSDNHMHFSHSSLWDQCHAYESWWEAIHRGWNNQALSAAHSVYWNTSGSGSSAVNGGRIVRSGQARYGYVIGTHGAQKGIELRTSGNVAPLDIAQGEGAGKSLSPSSLYQDQLARRVGRRKTTVSVLSKSPDEPGSGLNFTLNFSYLGIASSGTPGMEASGETNQADFYNSSLGVRLEAIKNVSTDPATLGDNLAGGSIDRDSAGYLGVIGNPGGNGLSSESGNTEGISFGITSLPGFNQETRVKLDAVIVRWMSAGEGITVVNRLTRRSITYQGSDETFPEARLDVSALGIVAKEGQMDNLGVFYPGLGANIRIAGVEMELSEAYPNLMDQTSWSRIHFGPDYPDPAKESSHWGNYADLDGDGENTFLEFSFNRDPKRSGPGSMLSIRREGDVSFLSYPQWAGGCGPVGDQVANGIRYRVQGSNTLQGDWVDASVNVLQMQSSVDEASGMESVELQLPFISGETGHFYRIKVSRE